MSKKGTKTKLILGILLLLVLISASTYAYFMVGTTNNFGTKTITGKFDNTGNVTLSTGNNLLLNLTNEQMLEKDTDVTYYASSTGAKTEETIENIGTAQVVGEGTYNCSYKIKVEDKSTNSMYTTFQSMSEKSDGQITLTVNGTDHELNTSNMFPLTIDGELRGLTKDTPQNITASFKIVNKKEIDQSILADTDINLSFKVEEFTCDNHTEETGAEYLIRTAGLWQSDLEGDGYRYTGTGTTCSYDDGAYTLMQDDGCKLYNYTRTRISDGTKTEYKYKTSCLANNSTYTYECTEIYGTPIDDNSPNNYICFGTIDKSECTGNTDAYMYRIIGVFPDAIGNQHMKLIKKEALNSTYPWHSNTKTDVVWESSDLYNVVNGNYFFNNTTYMPTGWSNRITSWPWSAVNTLAITNLGPNYSEITTQNIYLHELNKNDKTNNIGKWSTPSAKIGLMYGSDYQMSLGSSALNYTGSSNYDTLKTGWMHLSNNDISAANRLEWTISFVRNTNGVYDNLSYRVDTLGYVHPTLVSNKLSVRPTFYLNSNEVIVSGTGTLSDPYILSD